MFEAVNGMLGVDTASAVVDFLLGLKNYLLIFAGFSVVIFFHELGHFLAAKWCDVRVERFAVGFGKTLLAFAKASGCVQAPHRKRFAAE